MSQRIAGVSGGRTSALMALEYVPKDTVLTFQNTGKEHPKTYDFLQRVEDDLQRPILRLEYRSPPRGEPPSSGGLFEVVSHAQLARKGEPFRDLLSAIAAYRLTKGKGPIAPWARQRICTAYLKIRVQNWYIASLDWEDPTIYVGLRADEPERIAKMHGRNEKRKTGDEQAPLNEAGIDEDHVLRWWSQKPYDLDLPAYLGNCTGCFLKDEADLATALLDPETDAQWWLAIEEDYAPMRRGRTSYAEVLAEAPARMLIRQALKEGVEPFSSLPPRRHELIVKQERERQSSGFSCHCEGAEKVDDQMLLDLEAA